jgi:hypothetical protein
MKRPRHAGPIALALTLTALAIAGTPAAQAQTAPYFTIGGTRLVAGKTHNIQARAVKAVELTDATLGVKIKCAGLSVEKGVLLGSNSGEPGTGGGILVFTGCVLEEGNGAPECEFESDTIRTEPLKSELVENVEAGHGGKILLTETFPLTGKRFATLRFKGPGCDATEAVEEGQVVSEVLKDTSSESEKIELGQTPTQVTSLLGKFPSVPITEVWLISNGSGKIQKTGFTLSGDPAVLSGTALATLANTKFESEPNALWSALP